MTENIIDALPVEQLTQELQQKKAERLARVTGEGAPSELSSTPSSIRDGDTASLSSFQTGSFVHTGQLAGDSTTLRPRKTKAQLWNEIKIASVTRACTLVYTLSLLTLLTRIQLNLLGRLSYLSSVVALAQPPAPDRANSISLEDHDDHNPVTGAGFGNDFETNRRYLTFSWHLLHRGYAQILAKVQEAVIDTFGLISPTEPITAAFLSDLIISIRKKVEGATEEDRYAMRWLPYLLPPREEEESLLVESGVLTPPPSSSSNSPPASGHNHSTRTYVNTSSGQLRHLLDETADLIDSPTFTRIHTMILNVLFSYLIDTKVAAQVFPATEMKHAENPSESEPHEASFVNIPPASTEPKVKLATILAALTRQAHAIGRGSMPPPSQGEAADNASGGDAASSTTSATSNEYLALVDSQVKELEAFAAVIYAHNLHDNSQVMEQGLHPTASHPSAASSSSSQPPPRSTGHSHFQAANDPTNSTDLAAMTRLKSSNGTGVSEVGQGGEGEIPPQLAPDDIADKSDDALEGAWSRVIGGSSSFPSTG